MKVYFLIIAALANVQCLLSQEDYGKRIYREFDSLKKILPALRAPRSGIATVAAGNKIFFAGGKLVDGTFYNFYSNVDIYDVTTNSWSVESLSEPRSEIAAATIGNKVFFAGGEKDANYNASGVVDIYDISANRWSTKALSKPRRLITAVTSANKIYFAGGADKLQWYTNISNRVDIYDYVGDAWSTSTLNEPKAAFAGIAVANKIYWAGGFNLIGGAGSGSSCEVEIRDVITGTSSIAKLFRPGTWWIDFGNNAVLKNNKIVFFRSSPYNDANNVFEIYDITTNVWSIGLLPVNIQLQNAAIISVNNTIYVAGGWINGAWSKQVWKLEF